MKDPERWIFSRADREGRLIRAALAEEPPDAALGRVVSRLSSAGVAVGALGATVTQASHAGAVLNTALANGSVVGGVAGTVSGSAPLIVGASISKAVAIGFGLGSALLLGGHFAATAISPLPQDNSSVLPSAVVTRPMASSAALPTRASSEAPAQPPAVLSVRPQIGLHLPVAGGAVETAARARVEPAPLAVEETPPNRGALAPMPDPVASDVDAKFLAKPEFAPTPVPSHGTSDPRALAREVSTLTSARLALKRGDSMGALRDLAAQDALGGYRALGQEAALLRVEALAQSGQRDAAAALARRLLASGVAEAHRVRLQQWAALQK